MRWLAAYELPSSASVFHKETDGCYGLYFCNGDSTFLVFFSQLIEVGVST